MEEYLDRIIEKDELAAKVAVGHAVKLILMSLEDTLERMYNRSDIKTDSSLRYVKFIYDIAVRLAYSQYDLTVLLFEEDDIIINIDEAFNKIPALPQLYADHEEWCANAFNTVRELNHKLSGHIFEPGEKSIVPMFYDYDYN